MGPNWDPLVSHMDKPTWAPCGPPGQNVVGPTWAAQVGPTWQPTWAPSGAHVAFLLGYRQRVHQPSVCHVIKRHIETEWHTDRIAHLSVTAILLLVSHITVTIRDSMPVNIY